MTALEGTLTHAGLCWYCMQELPPRLDAFEAEIEGVRSAKDIENIHRMRVASRRLRAALPHFEACFPKKSYRRWIQEIANITRALGAARDADVQISFLQKQIKRTNSLWKQRHADTPGLVSPEYPALEYLLSELKKKRTALQVRVISSLDALEKSRIIPEMRAYFTAIRNSQAHAPAKALMYGVSPVAALAIFSRLETLMSYESWVNHPEAVAEHHATRIAAKKLRYTMELFGPVYRLGLKKPIARVKKIQEILGDIHDCDVWIDTITRLLLRERSRLRSDNWEKRPDTAVLASLKIVLQEREKERIVLYRAFVRNWEAQIRSGTWDNLRTALVQARKGRYRPRDIFRPDNARAAVDALCSVYPEGLPHSSNVSRLSLMIFDALSPVHRLGSDERFLLECAAVLHDIGWISGSRRHNRKSASIIFAAESLPFDIPVRAVISLAASAHRGKADPKKEVLYQFIPENEQLPALFLAAVLRVADGFDYTRSGNVQEIHCVINADTIIADAVSAVDITVEKEHARIKSDLFNRIFSRELVIR
jgi:CHAD domain-containing protein